VYLSFLNPGNGGRLSREILNVVTQARAKTQSTPPDPPIHARHFVRKNAFFASAQERNRKRIWCRGRAVYFEKLGYFAEVLKDEKVMKA
jgi:hypothetical protein